MFKHLHRGTKIKATWLNCNITKTLFVDTSSNYGTPDKDDWYIEAWEQLEPERKGYYYIKQQIDNVKIEILEA